MNFLSVVSTSTLSTPDVRLVRLAPLSTTLSPFETTCLVRLRLSSNPVPCSDAPAGIRRRRIRTRRLLGAAGGAI